MIEKKMVMEVEIMARQELAFSNPCARAIGGAVDLYWRRVEFKTLELSTILTVNK